MQKHDSSEEKIIKCYHCGNETIMHLKGEARWDSNDDDFYFEYTYKMFCCPVCHKVTLIEIYTDESMMSYNRAGEVEHYKEEKITYPINSLDSDTIPIKIKQAFEAALKSRSISNNICLMALRHTLELILNDKGATKWGLKDKIEEIAGKGLLPETLKEASALTKILGDSAAHDKSIEIDQYDVESMADFVEYIIEYLYIIPDKINRYKERFNSKSGR